ncbi:putative transposase [Sinorhizobium terangae]|nr:putative transposase [Sinorhizobium terangae]
MTSAAAHPVVSVIKWHLDETVISIRGKKHWFWRAVDQDGFVLEVLVQSRCNAKAGKRLIHKLLKSRGQVPRVMITDKLPSYDAARREIMPGVEYDSHKRLNNQAENSHQPFRRRERLMKRFKSKRHLQHLVSIHDPIANLVHIARHDITSSHHRELPAAAMNLWVQNRSRIRGRVDRRSAIGSSPLSYDALPAHAGDHGDQHRQPHHPKGAIM